MSVELSTLLPVALVLAGGAISPGPSLAVVLRNTIAGGRSRGVACSLGHGIGFGIYAMLAISGIALFKSGGDTLSTFLELAGGCFLVWLAIAMLRTPRGDAKKHRKGEVDVYQARTREGFVEGFLIAFLNPKIFVFLTAIFSQFVSAGMPFGDRIVLAGLAFIIDTSWYVIVSVALSGTDLLAGLRKRSRLVDIIVAALLLALALAIFSNHLL